MSVKTLTSVQPLLTVSPTSQPRTYSIAPIVSEAPREALYATPAQIESFLEAENPLGCIRGVMWVMVFNAAVFTLGLIIWQSCKFIW